MEDRLRPAQHAHQQVAALARTVRDDIHPFSRLFRPRLDRAGVGARVRSLDDLRRLAPITYAELGDAGDALLQPAIDTLRRHGPMRLRWKIGVADVLGRRSTFAHEHLDPAYKPMLWLRQGALDVGSSAEDLDQLADIGRRTLQRAGVRGGDRLVTLSEPEPDLGFWQLALGSRAGGVAALHLGSHATTADLEEAAPSVVAGPVDVLLELAQALREPLPTVTTVIALGAPLRADARQQLASVGAKAAVVAAWAPAGVRALWAECREGGRLHTWPHAEVVEVDAGELVWSGAGWRGTALLRLRTEIAGTIVHEPCAACGGTTPQLEVGSL